MRVHRLLLSLLMLTVLTAAAAPWATGAAAQQNNQCFAETGQCVGGRFLEYWRSQGLDLGAQGISQRESLALFGYPLTPEFTHQLEDGQRYTVQYFERARFEYHPENTSPYDVLLGHFGRRILASVPGAPTAPVAPSTQRGYTHFRETGHNVAPDFALFWSRNGGLAVFGYPLSDEFAQRLEDGKSYTVQYFERARFERHTAQEGQPYNVLLGQFGRAVLAEVPTAPNPGDDVPPPPAPASDNLFATILGPADAPAGWAVRPCEGDAPFLCVSAGQERVGTVTA
ncbi:MAG TPA: hypothetical protein VHN78_02410, partial [Chloroflexota bacterium]|nr:hypothetical protein [Chloroflexota bacterium]